MLITIAMLLIEFLYNGSFRPLLLHGPDPDPAALEDDAVKDAGNALWPKWPRVIGTDSGQYLPFSFAVVRRKPGGNLNGAKLTGDFRSFVQKPEQFVVDTIDFAPPSMQRPGAVCTRLVHVRPHLNWVIW
jgi:hypothetical protein